MSTTPGESALVNNYMFSDRVTLHDIGCWGLMVGPFGLPGDGVLFAEVEPAGSRWLPWKGRTSRWWFEVNSMTPGDECMTTWAYTEGGSGGGFTLRACVRRAQRSLLRFSEQAYEERLNARGQESGS